MGMLTFRQSGDFGKTTRFLVNAANRDVRSVLRSYGSRGLRALESATPVDTGLTASSWEFSCFQSKNSFGITWRNTNRAPGSAPVAILLQYGHVSRDGSFVRGVDYINPALRPIFESLANELWREVTGK